MTSIRSFLKRLTQKPQSINIVSGLPRSGTSMMMSALQAAGMPLLVDHVRKADQNNPRGYYEFELAKKLPQGESRWLKQARGRAVKIISYLLTYLPQSYDYRILFMERNLSEILASQACMLQRDGKQSESSGSDAELITSYAAHLEEIKSFMHMKPWIQVLFVSYNDILRQPEKAFHPVANFLEMELDPAVMAAVVDPSLYREKR
jgi:hypothetical protein